MDIGSQIRNLRKSKKISSTKLAELAGLGQSTISDIELGKKQPTIGTLEKICSALNITLADFFAPTNNNFTISNDIKELLNNAKNLTPEQLKQLTAFLKTLK